MPLTHLTLVELQQHAYAKPDDPELVAEVMARFTAGGLISTEEDESRMEDAREEGYSGGYDDGWDAGFEEGSNSASGSIA